MEAAVHEPVEEAAPSPEGGVGRAIGVKASQSGSNLGVPRCFSLMRSLPLCHLPRGLHVVEQAPGRRVVGGER